jgi:hypothetical protein
MLVWSIQFIFKDRIRILKAETEISLGKKQTIEKVIEKEKNVLNRADRQYIE